MEKFAGFAADKLLRVTALLVSHRLHARSGARIAEGMARDPIPAEMIVLPADPAARLADTDCARAEVAFFSGDVFPDHSRRRCAPSQCGKPRASASSAAIAVCAMATEADPEDVVSRTPRSSISL